MKTKITIEKLATRYIRRYYQEKILHACAVWDEINAANDADEWDSAEEITERARKDQDKHTRRAEWYWRELQDILTGESQNEVYNTANRAWELLIESRKKQDHDPKHWSPLINIYDGNELIDTGLREDLEDGAIAAGYEIRGILN